MRQEERQPSWLGPAIGALLLLMVVGLVALLWMTVGSEGEQEEGHSAAPLPVLAAPTARAPHADPRTHDGRVRSADWEAAPSGWRVASVTPVMGPMSQAYTRAAAAHPGSVPSRPLLRI